MTEIENPYILPEATASQTETSANVVSDVSNEDLQGMTSDIAHVNLFGSFLFCGTLVGIFLLRRFSR